jgi:hypothetical protein
MIFLAAFVWWELVIMALCAIGFFTAVVKEADELAGVIFVATLALCQWLFKIDVWSWVKLHYVDLLLFSIGYFFVGAGWSVFKWFRYVKEELKKYRELKERFLNAKKVTGTGTVIPKELLKDWEMELNAKDWPPSPSKHKDKLVRWIMVWPVSLVWALVEDFFVWLGDKLYSLIGKLYKGISDRLFAEMRKELEK